MDMETVRKAMKDEPENTLEFESGSIDDDWIRNYSLFVSYSGEKKVRSIYITPYNTDYTTSLGISGGDSVASMKEKLGEPASVKTEEDETIYQYCFNLVEGRYEKFQGSYDEFLLSSKEGDQLCFVRLGSENDKITSFGVDVMVA